jgi:hypothetical protein
MKVFSLFSSAYCSNPLNSEIYRMFFVNPEGNVQIWPYFTTPGLSSLIWRKILPGASNSKIVVVCLLFIKGPGWGLLRGE